MGCFVYVCVCVRVNTMQRSVHACVTRYAFCDGFWFDLKVNCCEAQGASVNQMDRGNVRKHPRRFCKILSVGFDFSANQFSLILLTFLKLLPYSIDTYHIEIGWNDKTLGFMAMYFTMFHILFESTGHTFLNNHKSWKTIWHLIWFWQNKRFWESSSYKKKRELGGVMNNLVYWKFNTFDAFLKCPPPFPPHVTFNSHDDADRSLSVT